MTFNSSFTSDRLVYRSKYFLPTLKNNPSEAVTPSHILMLRSGMIRQSIAGIYTWLPLGLRVLKKISAIIQDEMNKSGALEVLMPTIQPAELWKQSGRYNSYGKEMLRIKDRHNRELLYGPTNEEVITSLFANNCGTHKDVPMILYHIQWKLRDEIRPRFGVMRGREFLMKDAYSFDIDKESSIKSYNKMFLVQLKSYSRMGLKAIPMKAETGPIGGKHSHEFIVLTNTGESQIYCDKALLQLDIESMGYNYTDNLEDLISIWTKNYAATEDEHNPAEYSKLVNKESQLSARGIEVGHNFYFGDLYSKSFAATITDANGKRPVHMGSYGIGVSRLVGAIVEANHNSKGIIWPDTVAPFKFGIVYLGEKDKACLKMLHKTIEILNKNNVDILVDDRNERTGIKFAEMELIGIPNQIVIGSRNAKNGLIEFSKRASNVKSELISPENIFV